MRCFKYAKWLLLTVILWLSLAILYLALPVGESFDNDVEFGQSLWEGSSLLRVYHTEHFIPREYRLPRVRRRSYLALRYAYDRHTGILQIRNEDVPLTPLLSSSDAHARSKLVIPWSKLGDTDGVNPPWFPTGDAVLLYGFVSREWGRILLTVERVAAEAEGEVVLQVVPARMATQSEGGDEDAVPLGMPALASFHFALPGADAEDSQPTLSRIVFPPAPQSYGPSNYFWVRRALLSVLAPSAMLFMALAEIAGQLVKLLLIALGIVALLWIARELYLYRHDAEAGGPGESDEARDRQTAVLRTALREILGPIYAPRDATVAGRQRDRVGRTLSDSSDERLGPKEDV